ncbi:MAG: hypothetical protein AB1439_01970 [candidate division FCPU426 bacterium]
MPLKNGLQRLHFIFTPLLLIPLLLASSAQATTQFLVVAPGQTYNGSTPRSGSPNTQVAGETFSISVYCYDNVDNLPRNSGLNPTDLSSNAVLETFNPDPATLNQSYGGVSNALYTPITVNITPAATGNVNVTANASGGILADTISIPVQRVTNFVFTALGPYTAGSNGTLTIEARDASNNLCTAYNGTVHLYAYDAGVNGTTRDLGTVSFSSGVYTTSTLLLYHASPGYARIRIEKTNSPTAQYSPSFTINPNSFTRLLIIGPGQTIRCGENGGNGRASTSTTTTGQTAGTGFSVNVYACDDYWNTRTAASTVSLSCAEDPIFSYGGSQSFGGGSTLTFGGVTMYTVGDGTLTMTASDGSATNSTDNVPLSSADLDHFGVNNLSGTKTAGTAFTLQITGYDDWGNTVTTVSGNTTFELLQVATPISNTAGAWVTAPTVASGSFTSGRYNGTMTIYRAGINYDVRISNDSAGFSGPLTTTYDFTVNPAATLRYLFIMPGETYCPGEDYGLGYGHDGTPTDVTAGVFRSVSVYVTDLFGNRATTYNGSFSVSLLRTDAGASLTPVAISGGLGWVNMTLTRAYSGATQQQLIPSGGTPLALSSSLFNVISNTLDHFTVGNIGSSVTAGNPFNVNISARDAYENVVTSFSGPVYVSCPNLDYRSPDDSVIDISAYGTVSGVTWTVSSGFASGVWSHNIQIFRAGSSAALYVADQPNGTGHKGWSSTFQVVANVHSKVFMIVPGLEYRPGTGGGDGIMTGGYAGTPDAQQAGTAFSVTVYATDDWWNQVSSFGPFTMYSSPNTSNIYGTNWNFNNGNTRVAVVLNDADTYTLTADYGIDGIDDYTTPYTITSITINRFVITYPWTGGPSLPNVRAGVPIFISITAYADAGSTIATTFNGQANLVTTADWEEPFRVISPQRITFASGVWWGYITLYRAFDNITISCKLGSVPSNIPNNPSICHAAANRMLILATGMNAKAGIAPDTYPTGGFPGYTGNPATQEAGVGFDFKIFLCDDYYNVITRTADGGGDQIQVTSSDPYPASMGIIGNDYSSLPRNVNLGPVGVNSPQDPGYPYGGYRTTNFRLYTVGTNAYQTVTVTDLTNGSVTPFTLGGGGIPPVNVRHNSWLSRFQVDITSADKTAGVAFPSTVTAQDMYGNTMDNRNSATAFPSTNNVTLSTGSGTNTLYPVTVQLPYNGVGYPSLTLYKEYVLNNVTATYTYLTITASGTSTNMDVDANTFARLIPQVPSMDVQTGGGRYTAPNPSAGFIGYQGSPNVQTAGTLINNFRVYACDAYGNIAEGPTDLVYIKSTDRFGPSPRPVAINGISGYADFSAANGFAFHTAAESSQGDTPFTITAYDILETIRGVTRTAGASDTLSTSNVVDLLGVTFNAVKNFDFRQSGDAIEWLTSRQPAAGQLYQLRWVYRNPSGITDGTTPGIYVNPSSAYGLVTVVPGQALVEGSGNSNMSSGIGGVTTGGWYSGVTPTEPPYGTVSNAFSADPEISGAAFGVTVAATDQFGNMVSNSDPIEVRTTNETDPLGVPDVSDPIVAALTLGKVWVESTLYTLGQLTIFPWDTNAGSSYMNHLQESRSDIQVVSFGETHFKVWVNGVEQPGPVSVQAAPSTFTVKVEVRDDTSQKVVRTANVNFILEVFTNPATSTPGSGTLNVTFGQTIGGEMVISNQTYTAAETIYIRARNSVLTSDRPTMGYSPEVRVGASGVSQIIMSSDARYVRTANNVPEYQILANQTAQITGRAVDINGNPVAGIGLFFSLVTGSEAATLDGGLPQPIYKTTNGNGEALVSFEAGARNQSVTVEAAENTAAAGVTGDLIMGITVTQEGGVYPNPFNPLDPSQWANIDYLLQQNARVKINIYTLMGDLVWSREYPAGSSEGSAGVRTIRWNGRNDQGVTVANGGYICVIKVNDQEKYRFKIGVFKRK